MSVRGIARFSLKSGKVEEFRSIVEEVVELARTEDGVEEYSFFISGDDCVVLEQYRDGAALAAHSAGPVGTEHFPKVVEMAESVSIELFGDIDDAAKEIASAFGASVYPGPTYEL